MTDVKKAFSTQGEAVVCEPYATVAQVVDLLDFLRYIFRRSRPESVAEHWAAAEVALKGAAS